ncbi:MAG: hypothetical protein KDD55_02655 [Bdellovibrionales bacterium]|nr:hypothetical protein [Bdellovibrionales bacterium]
MSEILPSVTTGNLTSSTWEMKIRELVDQRISRAALFLTYLDADERKRCYRLLEEAHSEFTFVLPFVHASSTMTEDEYRYLSRTFGTRYFNLHSAREFPLEAPLSDILKKRICIENTQPELFYESDLKGFGGICFDLSHLKDERITTPFHYKRLLSLAHQFDVRVNHISVVSRAESSLIQPHSIRVSKHVLRSEKDFSYLKEIPHHAIAPLIAIEVENSLAEQLDVIPRIAHYLSFTQKLDRRRHLQSA